MKINPSPRPPEVPTLRLDQLGRPRCLAAGDRFIGIDVGAETIKVVELAQDEDGLRCVRRRLAEHGKQPGLILLDLLEQWDWERVRGAAASGRLSRQMNLRQVPTKQAQALGYHFLFGQQPATVVSIGSHGFSVLELRPNGMEVFRENNRCAQGTGNFLRQLVERFSLTIAQASALCADVEKSAPLSGRCPVILKTDMTHLANKGEDRVQILAGLFDAICENVLVLIKPGISPSQVLLIGGVSRSGRVQRIFQRSLARLGMSLKPTSEEDALFLEAFGSAVVAAEQAAGVPPLHQLLAPPSETKLERLGALHDSLALVQRMKRECLPIINGESQDLILGFDIGSTGSKAVALTIATQKVVWEGYRQTGGAPVEAAQALLQKFVGSPAGHCTVLTVGVTGSGREIVGSLMTTCYGKEAVFILNEIAAHATGALHYDARVDTIFEIGGQDAKYIRLAGGRVVDCAMNEACSAGTGSFIEEQGRKFAGIQDVVQLGHQALSAASGVSLGQHCSVFMAEVIDESVAAGVDQGSIIAGLYDSIVQNYLYRVKGSRSVGQVIFCQGMPFSADALATAVARQTQSQVVIPPNPGTVGALGIALLAYREISSQGRPPLDLARFLRARIEQKETFVCKATVGCGGPGNRCRIDCLRTVVEGQRQKFTWGGGCALYDKGTRKKKLPDRSPDPFREREELLQELIQPALASRQRPRIAITDEFSLKGLFPFYTSFLHHLGFDLLVMTGADQADLKRGIQDANVPFCAPMQLYHGLVSRMAQQQPDYLFLPMLRGVTRVADEEHAVTCPIVQASPDMLRWDLGPSAASKILSPVINIGAGNLDSPEFLASCRQLALDLGVTGGLWRSAHQIAQEVQTRFEMRCEEIGRRALSFCAERGIAPVVVLGRVYTIYSNVLNSNVPAILREQGAIGIPVDCYPVAASQPIFRDMYWGYGQRILRAAHQIRRTPGVYSLYCSNYSCGPDSFNLHFYSYIMEGKPFAIIETDGHSGDAGTKTRVEAFLYCVEEDRRTASRKSAPDFRRVELEQLGLADIRQRGERLLVPSMGPGSEAAVVCLRGIGVDAECLPLPDRETVRMGRRYTSGKECLPVCITLGSLLQRLQREPNPAQRFAFLMPRTHGPCRLGTYNVLNRITLERLHWIDRVRIWSPADSGYFVGTPPGFAILAFTGFMASDLLSAALLDVRPSETRAGAAQAVYRSYWRQLLVLLETQAKGDLSAFTSLRQVISGQLFGVQPLLRQAAADFSAIRAEVDLPTVLLVGEIYMRCDPFTNDFIVEKLEARGLRVRLAPFNEWLEYVDHLNCRINPQAGFSKRLSSLVQKRIQNITYAALAESLGWPRRTTVPETLRAAGPFIREALQGEAVLTLGGPVHDWRQGHIDAVLSVGPLECMPNKIAEAQFFHAAETERLLNLTLSLNGEPADPEVLDNFAFEVHARHRQRRSAPAAIKLDPDAKRPSMSSPTACRQAAQGQPELTQS